MDSYDNIFVGFRERMKNLGVFSPILYMKDKIRFRELPLVSLAIAVMLYTLENMLMNRPTTTDGIHRFLKTTLWERCDIQLNNEEIDELREVLVDDFLRNFGRNHEFEYFDLEQKSKEIISFRLFEYDEDMNLDMLKERKISLRLSTEGIEMLFKTKEMYGELQISIAQLYFKQQMQKGLFHEALNAINDITIAIKKERFALRDLQGEIVKDAISVSKKELLKKQLESVHDKLTREREVFNSLKNLVDEKIHSYHMGELTAKEIKGIELVMQIQRKLASVIAVHESLFTDKQKLQMVMTHSMESLILNAFSVKLNFEREILGEISTRPIDLETLKTILNPLLPFRRKPIFNPLEVFQPQRRITRKQEQDVEVHEVSEEEMLIIEKAEEMQRVQKEVKVVEYLRILGEPILTNTSVTISDILSNIKNENLGLYQELTNTMNFYSFLVDLHQSDYTSFQRIEHEVIPHLPVIPRCLARAVEAYPELEAIGYFSFEPNGSVITLPNGFVLSDFAIRKGNLYGNTQG
ncbi:hypothetical protein [Cohnella sp.]|uniref:hypothetical protein n=1 Tax=Cohnella sp. TaxID=1883426 RepID=UPI003562678A